MSALADVRLDSREDLRVDERGHDDHHDVRARNQLRGIGGDPPQAIGAADDRARRVHAGLRRTGSQERRPLLGSDQPVDVRRRSPARPRPRAHGPHCRRRRSRELGVFRWRLPRAAGWWVDPKQARRCRYRRETPDSVWSQHDRVENGARARGSTRPRSSPSRGVRMPAVAAEPARPAAIPQRARCRPCPGKWLCGAASMWACAACATNGRGAPQGVRRRRPPPRTADTAARQRLFACACNTAAHACRPIGAHGPVVRRVATRTIPLPGGSRSRETPWEHQHSAQLFRGLRRRRSIHWEHPSPTAGRRRFHLRCTGGARDAESSATGRRTPC